MRRVFLDLESLPSPAGPEAFKNKLKPPGNYSKPESIAKWLEENAESEWRKTALDGGYGELLCVGYAIDDDQPVVLLRDDELLVPERGLLADFLGGLASYDQPAMFIGHNITWDLHFLYKRAAVYGLLDLYRQARLPIAPSPWSPELFDTMYQWTWERNKGIKLSELCDILGIDSPKGEMDGSNVYDYHLAGRHNEIATYCMGDVEAVREIYKRLAP